MDVDIYRIMHLIGWFMVYTSLGGFVMLARTSDTAKPNRMLVGITHGVGMLLALVGGFGMMAKLGLMSFPLFIIIKIVLWLVVGASPAVMRRMPNLAVIWWFTVLGLALVAAVLGRYKPFWDAAGG